MRGIEQYLQVDAATLGALKYAGTWNASTNTPTLASGVGVQGQYYVVSVAGSTNLDGETAWQVGDWAVFNGTAWQKVDGGSTGLLSTLTVTGNTFLATTSGNVGIGTSSPASKLHVNGGDGNQIRYQGATHIVGMGMTGANPFVGSLTNAALRILTNAAEVAQFDVSGNLGLGVTPSAWDRPAYQSTQNLALLGLVNTSNLAQNAYFNGSWRYMTTAAAAVMQTTQGSFNWFTAPSGTAGNAISFTQAMTLDASGNLGIGTSSPSVRLDVSGGSIRTTSWVDITPSTVTNNALYRSTNTGGVFYSGLDNSAGGVSGSAYAGVIWHTGAYPIVFSTNNAERARIPAAGGMVVGTAALATNATDGFLYVPTCAGTPTGTPTTQTGTAPIVIDTTNNKLYFYSGGQWRDAGP